MEPTPLIRLQDAFNLLQTQLSHSSNLSYDEVCNIELIQRKTSASVNYRPLTAGTGKTAPPPKQRSRTIRPRAANITTSEDIPTVAPLPANTQSILESIRSAALLNE